MGGKPVAIALDTKGPEIRTGMLVGDDVELVKGSSLTVHTSDDWKEKGDAENLHMDYKNICNVSHYRRVCGGKGRVGGGGGGGRCQLGLHRHRPQSYTVTSARSTKPAPTPAPAPALAPSPNPNPQPQPPAPPPTPTR